MDGKDGGREGLPTSAHELDTNLSSPRSHVSTSPRRSSNNSPDSAAGKVELTFSSVPTLPMLELPKGNADSFNGKYDYSIAVDKPFAFDTPSDEELTNFRMHVEPDDFLSSIPEPDTGIFPEEFDREKFEKVAGNISCFSYVPYVFMSPVAPLRPPDQFEEAEKCEDVNEVTRKKKAADGRITFIKITDVQLGSKVLKSLGKSISQYGGLSVLILRSLKLQKLDDFVLPKLQYVDLSQNLLKTVKACLAMFKHSPYLEMIKLQDNPVTSKPSYRSKVIGNCTLFLKALDGQRVEIQERIQAMITYGPKQVKNTTGPVQWDLSFVATPEVNAMKTWQPSQLVMLTLPRQNLTYFNVGGLVNLEYLDLSRNAIREIRGMGLEKCHALQHLNLKQNLIAKRENLKVLGFLPCLQYLMLKGNPVTKAPDYRLTVTFETRYLRGSNRTTGLVELDEVPITIDERIAALEANKTSIDIPMWRWKYMIMQTFGHMQIKTPDVVSKIKSLSYPRSRLTVVELSGFTSVELLDLSKNSLKDVAGLECLHKLRFLNLSDNPKLKWKAVLSKLRNVTTLEKANLCVTMEGHPRQADNKKYRAYVLKELLLNNPDLFAVDEVPITPAERVETFRSMKGVKSEKAEHYRFLLAVNINSTQPTNRKYHPEAVAVGKQYDPAKVTSLLRLHNMGIQMANFSPFENLEEINLARNKLTDLTTIGLQSLKKLKVLDVSFNQLSGSLKSLAAFLDTLKTLECLSIRGNPIVKNFPEDRKRLISLMGNMKEVSCRLQVIDIQISISERIEAWKKCTAPKKGLTLRKSTAPAPEQLSRFRMEAIIFQRIPTNVPASQLKTLDLHECALASFDVTKFTNLEMLLMRKNDVRTPSDIAGLMELSHLRVLDLRDNCFEKLEDFVSIVNSIASLVAIGLRGNKCTVAKDYRTKFIAQLPQLHESRFRLAMVDNMPITIDEICSVWKAPKGMTAREKFFHVLILRKTPDDVPFYEVKELDLSLCGLTNVDLSKFSGLEKLSLRGNSLDAANLLDSHVTDLEHLTALDVSDNNICDFGALITIASSLPALEYFSCSGNPCFPNNEPLLRVNLIFKLPSMKALGAPLKLLNGHEISIDERCTAVERDPYINIENFRMDLLFEKTGVDEQDRDQVLRVQELDLNYFNLSSLRRLQPFSKLAFLIASHNHLKSLEEEVFFNLPCLTYLDLQHNDIEDKGAKLLAVFSRMPALKALFIRKSTKDKSKTAKPKQYLKRVCSVVRQIELLDGLPNPFQATGPSGSGIHGFNGVGGPPPLMMNPGGMLAPPPGVQPMYPMGGVPDPQMQFVPAGYLPHMAPMVSNGGYAEPPQGDGFGQQVTPPWFGGGLSSTFSKVVGSPVKTRSNGFAQPPTDVEEEEDEESLSSESDASEEDTDEDDDVDAEDEVAVRDDGAAVPVHRNAAGLIGVAALPLQADDGEEEEREVVRKNPWNTRKTIRSNGQLVSKGRTPTLKKVEPISDASEDSDDGFGEGEDEQEEEWEKETSDKGKDAHGDDGDSEIGEEDDDLEEEKEKEEEKNESDDVKVSGSESKSESDSESESDSDSDSEAEAELEVALESEQSEVEVEEGGRLWEREKEIILQDLEDAEQKSFKESMRQQAAAAAKQKKQQRKEKADGQDKGKAKKGSQLFNGKASHESSSSSSDTDNGGKDDEYWETDEEGSENDEAGSGSTHSVRKQTLWSSTPTTSDTLRLLASSVSPEILADYG